jgi:hypothetical protein
LPYFGEPLLDKKWMPPRFSKLAQANRMTRFVSKRRLRCYTHPKTPVLCPFSKENNNVHPFSTERDRIQNKFIGPQPKRDQLPSSFVKASGTCYTLAGKATL